jgi:hypothetical protein
MEDRLVGLAASDFKTQLEKVIQSRKNQLKLNLFNIAFRTIKNAARKKQRPARFTKVQI